MSYPPNTIPDNRDDQQLTLKKILLWLNNFISGGGSGGGTITADVNLTKVGGAAIAIGQAVAAASLPVVIASNQSAVPVTSTPVSGTPVTIAAVAGSTTTIPIGAFNVGILITTGTGTIGGVSWPVNTPYNIVDKLATTLAVVLGNPGTAAINYLT